MQRTRMQGYALVMAVGVMAALMACSSDNGSTTLPGSGDGDTTLDVDNCTLLTNEEVSGLAGKQLAASQDGPFGCGYVEEGEVVADFSIRSYRQDGDAAAAGTKLAPSLTAIPMSGIGDDAVALSDADGSVNFLVARKGNLFVELVMTFLDVEKDSPSLQQAGQLASTALGRLADAA